MVRVCTDCGTPVEYAEMYCPKCNPGGLTIFEGVTKEAHDKLNADYAALRGQAGDMEKMAIEMMLQRDIAAREADLLRSDIKVAEEESDRARNDGENVLKLMKKTLDSAESELARYKEAMEPVVEYWKEMLGRKGSLIIGAERAIRDSVRRLGE